MIQLRGIGLQFKEFVSGNDVCVSGDVRICTRTRIQCEYLGSLLRRELIGVIALTLRLIDTTLILSNSIGEHGRYATMRFSMSLILSTLCTSAIV